MLIGSFPFKLTFTIGCAAHKNTSLLTKLGARGTKETMQLLALNFQMYITQSRSLEMQRGGLIPVCSGAQEWNHQSTETQQNWGYCSPGHLESSPGSCVPAVGSCRALAQELRVVLETHPERKIQNENQPGRRFWLRGEMGTEISSWPLLSLPD